MEKTKSMKLIGSLLIIVSFSSLCGFYALLVWGKHEPVKIYQGHWIEDTQKIKNYWSVGYLELIK